jgi:hypothetical protein
MDGRWALISTIPDAAPSQRFPGVPAPSLDHSRLFALFSRIPPDPIPGTGIFTCRIFLPTMKEFPLRGVLPDKKQGTGEA